jgi:hypothetical protein
MSPDYDASEFVDGDMEASKGPASAAFQGTGGAQRAPTREEVDAKVAEAQQRLAELKRQQEELERERAALEETRRRRAEFQTSRQELLESLTRGTGLLQEAEFNSRRDAEQTAKTLNGLREALAKVEALREEGWTRDDFNLELTRALTSLENARMEWNAARLKFPILSTPTAEPNAEPVKPSGPQSLFDVYTFGDLCRLGFAFTWPLAVVALLALGMLVFVLLRR